MKLHHGMKVHQILRTQKWNGFGSEVSAARKQRIEGAEHVTRWVSVTAVDIGAEHRAGAKAHLIERVSSLGRDAPGTNGIAAEAAELVVSLPVVVQPLRGRPE